MLPKKNRLDTKTVDLVFKTGSFINSTNFSLKFIKNTPNPLPRLAFVVPKSLAKEAVVRNKLRRQGYIVGRDQIGSLPPGFAGVFMYKKIVINTQDVGNEIKNIFSKIN